MGVLPSLIILLLVAAAGGGWHGVEAVESTEETTVSYYSSASEAMTYWQTMLPNSHIPPAIHEHLTAHADDTKTSLPWSLRIKNDDGKATFRWGPYTRGDDGKATLRWGSHTKEDDGKATLRWGPYTRGDDGKATLRWGSHTKEDDHKTTLGWGERTKEDDGKVTLGGGPFTKDEDKKATLKWGVPTKEHDGKATLEWGPNTKENDRKATLRWGAHNEEDEKLTFGWNPNNIKAPMFHIEGPERHHHHHIHGSGHQHARINLADLLFLEDVLTPGTTIIPYIESSVWPAPFLRREVADSIPLSTKNFTNILSMFAPTSLTMAGGIWSTLHTCEHPDPLECEQQACATSMESMVELVTSVIGTRDLRAFSSSTDVPAEGFASPSTPRYTVAAVRAVTAPAGAPSTTVTCHGVTFPYAVFYCHALNPTRVYAVTLRRGADEEEGVRTPPATMRALAVCHLDTSRFDPENPFFVARGLKPGDAAVCHFLSRDSVLWAAPASSAAHENDDKVATL